MSITIPAWVMWSIGGLVIGALALLGLLLLWLMWKGRNIDFRINW